MKGRSMNLLKLSNQIIDVVPSGLGVSVSTSLGPRPRLSVGLGYVSVMRKGIDIKFLVRMHHSP